MRKQILVNLSCALIILIFFPSCRHLQQGQEKQAPPLTPVAQPTADTPLSANYYYLKSRVHIKNAEFEQAKEELQKALDLDPDSFTLTRDLMGLYMREENESKAIRIIEAFIRNHPDNVEALLLYIQLNKKGIDEKELIEMLNRILAVDPDNQETYIRLGKIYIEQKNHTAALTLFEKMTARFPDDYVGQYYLGEALMNLEQYDRAKAQFLKTIELEPELVAPRMALIDIYQTQKKEGFHEQVIDTFHQVLNIEPDNYSARFGLALSYYHSGLTQQAEEIFMELAGDADENSRMVMAAADEFISGQRYDDAILIFSKLSEKNPDNSTLHFFLGMAFQAADKNSDAVKSFLKVKSDHSQYKKSSLSIAYLYKEMGELQTAIDFMEDRLKEFPKDADIISYLSSFYEKEEKYDRALELIRQGLAGAPDDTGLLFRMGMVQDKAGLKEECITTMEKVIQIDPKDASALNYLGYTYAEMGIKLELALDLISQAYDLRPDDGYITDSLGWVYFQMGNYEKAVVYLKKAAELTQYETIIAHHLGDAYMKLNQYKEALAAFEKSLANAGEQDQKHLADIQNKIEKIKKLLNE
jgi:tetratricopeptide (TPR) repeat protein